MQVEMNGGIIVAIAMILIGIIATGLVVYYIRKGKQERTQNNEEGASSSTSPTVDADG